MQNNPQSDVTVIIANYNTKPVLQDCLENLSDLKLVKNTIVVDNASSDGSSEMVASMFPSVTLISLKENKGISYSYNLGANAAKTDYLLFLGSDAFPEKDTIPYLASYMDRNPKVGIATCKVVQRNGALDMDSHRAFPTPVNSFLYFTRINPRMYFMQDQDLTQAHEIDACISHFMFVRKKGFDEINGFDQDFFVYGEDIDFCYRLKGDGWKIMYIPQVKALHYKGVSVGLRKESRDITQASKETRIKMARMSADAMELFFKKHYLKNYPQVLVFFILLTIRSMKMLRVASIYWA